MTMRNVEIEVPVEIEGFTADCTINFQLEGANQRVALDNMNGYVRVNKGRVYLEGNFDVSELAALIYFADEER